MNTPAAKDSAIQRAFEQGQQAYREGKSALANPFPPAAEDYCSAWQQGFECEHEAIHD
jgi:hypothetical protein